MDCRIYRIDGFLLLEEWKPKGEIFFVVRGEDNEKEHKNFVEQKKKELLDKNDDTYTSWVFTGEIYKDLGKSDPYVSVIAFRVRDAY